MQITHKIVFVMLLFICPLIANAERVVLKSGESFDGTIIERNDQFITIQTGGAPVYLSLEHVSQIVDNDQIPPDRPAIKEPVPPAPAAVIRGSQISHIPTASRQDGQFYYEQAKKDLQAGKFDDSVKNLYAAASLGVKDVEGLQEKIEFARKAVEHVEAKKNEIKKVTDGWDPNLVDSLLRGGIVIGVAVLLFLVVAMYKKIKTGFDISNFVKSRSSRMPLDGVDNSFLVKGSANKRVCAFLLDILIAILPSLLIIAIAGALIGNSLILVYLLLKDCFAGQSLGKKILGLQIIDQERQPAAPNSITLRNFYWVVVIILPLFHPYLALGSVALVVWEYLGMLNDPAGQRFGDKISSTRVVDTKPGWEDWKYIVLSLVIVFGIWGLFRLTVFSMSALLNRVELNLAEKDYQDDLGRFSFAVPAGFIVDPQYAHGNALVFNQQKGQQLFSVFVMDLTKDQVFASDQLDMAAVSFWSAKLRIDPQQILSSAALVRTQMGGKPVVMYSYSSHAGKNVSVCLLNEKQFYEINFLFKNGDVDEVLIKNFIGSFLFLNASRDK